ncbi:MAG: immunoglobulin domain-containing protein [Bacteroidales bacterium]|jgi:gliding motility-associated-like protein|nr:immunoglobulin domain-containing protein [Bacteroidales bacterium]
MKQFKIRILPNIKILLFIVLQLFFVIHQSIAATIDDANDYTTYCTTYGTDLFIASSPNTKNWYCDVPGAMTATVTVGSTWQATFDPSAVAGPYPRVVNIRYCANADGSGVIFWEVNVTVDEYSGPAVTFDPVPDICVLGAVVDLEPYVNPTPGTFTGAGISGNDFDPAVAGVGTHTITYTYPVTGCASSINRDINVYDLVVTLNPFADVCVDAAAFALSGGSPAGGTYYIDGVANGTFDPAVEGTGVHVIDYEYNDGSCTVTATENLTVNALPSPTIFNLLAVHCQGDPVDPFDYTPASSTGTGVFSGVPAGITDNTDGTASYDPASTGLGSFKLVYTFTDTNGCTNSVSTPTKTGTELFFVDLDPQYCDNEGDFQFKYTPGATANPGDGVTIAPVTAAFTDNGDGTANFNPSAAGADTYTFTYQYTDPDGCVTVITQDVIVSIAPTASIGGLSAAYCSNDADDTDVLGFPAPVGDAKGVFSTLIAGLTDNGDGTATFSPSTAPVGGPYDITYTYTDAVGCSDTHTETVTINQAPTATISGTTTICEGAVTNLTTTFSVNSDYTYVITDGSNNYSFTVAGVGSDIQPVSPVVNTTYTLVSVTDDATGCDGSLAGSAVITVTPAVNITTQPVNKVACPGDNISFNVVSDGVNLSYAWEFDPVGAPVLFGPVGINSASHAINGVDATDAGTYRVTVSSATCGGPEVSDEVTLSVGNTTTITAQPTDVAACDGTSQNLQVLVTGDNLTYEWRENGVAINTLGDPNYVGDDTPILTINNLDNTYDGNVYTCFISGDCGDETSNPATVTVDGPIVITTQPTNKTACPGGNINYSVSATGTSLSYQWQYNDGVWNDIAGATGDNLVLNNVDAVDAARTYRCEVSSPCGEIVYSDDVTLTLYVEINITTQPSDATVCETDVVNFQVISDGSNLLYQWQFNDGSGYVDLVDTVGVRTGSTSSSLTLLTTALADEGLYRCVITNVCGTDNSNAATLVVDEAVAITAEPTDIDACANDDVSFTVTATGTDLTYQWQFDDGGGYANLISGAHISGSGSLVSGVNNATLLIDNIAAGDDGDYRCLVTNGCGTVTSSTAILAIHASTVLNAAFPTDKSKCIGESANFTVDVTSGTVTSYKWQFDIDSDGVFVDLNDGPQPSGSNIPVGSSASNALSVDNLFAADAGLYRCVVTGICGTVNSNAATLDIDEPVTITKDPTDKMECETEDVTFSITATGTGLSYQWENSGGTIAGAVNPNLVLTNVNAGDEDDYYCVVTNSCNSQTSASANLTLYTPISVTADPASITRCEGDDAAFNITVDPTSDSPAYQWYQDGNPLSDGVNGNGAVLSGIGTNSLYITGLTTGEAGVYTCEVTGPCNTESRTANLTVNDSVVVNTNPVSKLVCPATNTSFIVNATGGVTGYQWQYDDLGGGGFVNLANAAPYSGVFTTALTITNVAATEAGVYRCEITGSCIGDVVYSNSANLTVGVTTAITAQPIDVTGCETQDIIFSLTAEGTVLSYQWFKNPTDTLVDFGDISGATTNTLSIANIEPADAGVYYCEVFGTCGDVTSGTPTLVVNEGLTINTNPISKTICPGANTSYVVNVSGDINAYQWQFNDGGGFVNLLNGVQASTSTVAGALTNTLFINDVDAGDAGTYRCVIDGVCEDLNSSPAGLTVATATIIVTDPTDASLCEGDDVDFSVDATGTNLFYEWYKASQVLPLSDGVSISGSTTNTLSITGLVVADADVYSCVVSGTCNNATSAGANLSVGEYLTINTQPTNKTACPGGTASFNVNVSGDIISYQWYKDGVLVTNPTVSGATATGINGATLTITGIDALDDGNYRCEIVGDCETIFSNTASLTVNVTTTSTDPANVTDCEGETVSFSVTTTGTSLTYQWYKDAVELDDGVQISGSTFSGTENPTLVIENANPDDDGSYHCVVDGQCTDITTNTAILTITPTTAVTLQPSDFSVLDGGTATFTITAESDIASYLWYKDGVSLANVGNISGADLATLTINPVASGVDEGDYHCVVTGNTCGNATSNTATLTILLATSVTTQPAANTTKCQGEDLLLSITTTGGPHTYQWQFDDGTGYANLNIGAHISGSGSSVSGVTSTSLVIKGIQPDDEGFYRCVLNGGPDATNSALVNVIETITINTHPTNKERCDGDPVTFSVSASGGIDQYQWKKDGVDIPAENASSYTIAAVVAGDAGTYTCVVEALGTCADITSNSAQLTVNDVTVLNSGPADQLLCEGASVTLSIDATGSNLTYQWYFDSDTLTDGGSISGSQEKDLIISNALLTDAGNYYCEITGSCGSETTVPVDITVDETTTITTQPISRSKCIGDQVQFVVAAEGASLTYQWRFNDGSGYVDLLGETNTTLTIDPIAAIDAGNYYCEIVSANGCGDIDSDAATLTAYENTVLVGSPVDETLCEGASTTLTADVTGGNLTYTWIRDNIALTNGPNISGVNTANLEISNATLTEAGIYQCNISGFCGASVSTTPATITIDPSTTITTQPADGEICVGDSKLFIVDADGLDLNYQWRFNGADIPGETNSQLSIDPVDLTDDGIYTCFISSNNSCGDVLSSPATLTVHEATVINSSPIDRTECEGATTTFTVDAAGGNLQYQWIKDGVTTLSDGGNISGAETKDLMITGINLIDDGVYTCKVSGFCTNQTSDPADLIVNPSTIITSSPSSKTNCKGTSVTFYVTATGSNLVYEWQKGTTKLDSGPQPSGSIVTNETTSALNITDIAVLDAGSYRCVVTGDCGTQNSDPAILTVYDSTLITTQPTGGNYCEGDPFTLSVVASGDNLVYQWKKDGVALSDTGNITGSQAPNLIINNASINYSGVYTCYVSGSCGSENSSTVTVQVKSPTIITTQPENKTICEGDVAVFSVDATGEGLLYEWQQDENPLSDGVNISGSTSSILSLSNLVAGDAGEYRCVVSGDCGSVNSDAANLIVNVYPSAAGVITGPTEVCQGSSNIIYEVAAIANADDYVWSLPVGVTILSGDNTRLIEVEFDNNELGGNIAVRGLNSCGYGTASPILNVVANPIPVAQAGADQSLCISNTNLTAIDPGTATGTWTVVDGPAIVQNVNLNTSYVYNLREGTNTLVWEVEENSCSSNDTVVIVNNHVTVEAGTDLTICSDSIMLDGSSVPTGAIGSWSVITGIASFTDGNDPNTYAKSFASGINILKWSVSKGGCVNYDTIIVNNQRPTQAYAGIDQSICEDSTNLSANLPTVGNGLWSVVVGAATFANDTINNTVVTGLSKGVNTLRWTISNGICSISDDVKITNNQLNVNAGVDQVICDKTTTLDAINPPSGEGYWAVDTGSAVFVDINQYNTIVTGLAKGLNVLTWNVNNNNCISTDTVSITNDFPTKADAGPDTIIEVDYATLQGNIPSVGTGEWQLISGSAVIDNPLQYNTSVTALAFGENTFRWTITNNSCISTDDVVINNNAPTGVNAGSDQSICSSIATLEGSEPNYYGQWSVVQGSAIFSNPDVPITDVTGLAKGDNILRWSVWQNGWTSDDVVISNDSPTTANAGTDKILCVDSVNLAGNDPIIGKGVWTVISGSGQFENDTVYNTKVTNLTQGENIFKWTITNKSCSDDDLVIIRNDFPTIAEAGLDQISCESTINLTPNTPSVGIGSWSVLSGSANFEGNTAKNMAVDVNIFRYTIINNSCSSFDDVSITNHEPSDANAGSNKVLCTDSISLAANIAVVGNAVWTIQSGSATLANPLDPTSKVTNLSQGLNVFRWTVTYNACVKFDEITINNAFVEATTGLDQDICSESTYLEANNPSAGTGSWSILGGSGSATFDNINQPDTRVSGLDKGANILRWTITNEICISTSDVTINNNLPTEAFAGPDQALCADNSILQANTPIEGTGSWSILSGSANIITLSDPSSLVSNLDYGVNTLRWTISKSTCVSTDEVVIANKSTINSNAGLDQTLCSDSTLLFANIPAYGIGTWSVVTGSATFKDNNVYNTKVVNIGRGDNILSWVITNGGCSSSDEVTITNNYPIKAIAGADQTICGNTTNLQANNPQTYIGTWTLVSGAANFVNSSQNNTQVTGLNPGSNTLRWTISNSGCTSIDDVVIYNDLPYEADAGEDFDICGSSTSLYANNPSTGIGEWSVISGSATFDEPTRFDATVSNLGFGANTLRWTITYPSCTTIDDVVVTNNKLDVYAGVDQIINESTTLLAASNPSTGTGLWTVIGGAGTFAQSNNSITEVSGLGSGLNTFRWSVEINGCISFDDVSITYNVPPAASFVITESEGCPPLDMYFVNNSLDNLPFTWDFDDGTTSDEVTLQHTYTDPGIYKPSLTIISATGDVIVKDTTITVFDQPEASFLIVNKQVYIPEEEAIFINASTHAVRFEWEFGDGSTSTEIDPRYTYETEGIYDVILHVWSEHDCYDSTVVIAGVEVIKSAVIVFPNAFTPNLEGTSGGYYNPNDFSNDVFYPIGEGLENYHLEVFNRWGVLVFESSDFNIGWDGYYNGKLLSEGVYVWKVTGKYNNGKDFNKVGTIMLLR